MGNSKNTRERKIIKKSGQSELFIPEKLCGSIVMAGAPKDLADQVCTIVDESIESGVSTDKIFTVTRKYLNQFNPKISALYALERGLGALGPSGFLFEQYVAELLSELDYKVKTNVYVKGEGVEHEVDVWAEKGRVVYIVEAKYRNDYKAKTHINEVMYADARIGDIQRQLLKEDDTREYFMWVVTNTQFTDAAMNYAEHRDIQLIGWNHPKYINLMKIVSERDLYPVTILPSITKEFLHALAADKIVLVKKLAGYGASELQKKYNLSTELANILEREIKELTQ